MKTYYHVITDPETGTKYSLILTFGNKGVEIEIYTHGPAEDNEAIANVCVEAYGGKGQVIISDAQSMRETGGDDPQTVELFLEVLN